MNRSNYERLFEIIENVQRVLNESQDWLLGANGGMTEEMENAYNQLEEIKEMIEDHDI